jgi:hypothetical protein
MYPAGRRDTRQNNIPEEDNGQVAPRSGLRWWHWGGHCRSSARVLTPCLSCRRSAMRSGAGASAGWFRDRRRESGGANRRTGGTQPVHG